MQQLAEQDLAEQELAGTADKAMIHRLSAAGIAVARPQGEAASPDAGALANFAWDKLFWEKLTSVSVNAWQSLAERALEPNGYYLPSWELAVNAHAKGRTGVSALCALNNNTDSPLAPDSDAGLIGLMPIVSLWRAYGIPLPALASAHPYGTLCTPLLDRNRASEAAGLLLQQAREVGAHAILLRDIRLYGPAMQAFNDVLRRDGLHARVMQSYARACLDATVDADALLDEALGHKKLKELRRQRNRLAEHGAVRFDIARTPDEVARAIETFMTLEASGWKGERGTALKQDAGDASFIRRATKGLAETRQCEIVTLRAGETPVASGIVLRHQDRAFFFKVGIDERFAKFSPGVQLTLELTRHLCADPGIASADSTASADHPMINPIWRGRFEIGDVLIPLKSGDPVVTLIHAALTLGQWTRETARRMVHFIRR